LKHSLSPATLWEWRRCQPGFLNTEETESAEKKKAKADPCDAHGRRGPARLTCRMYWAWSPIDLLKIRASGCGQAALNRGATFGKCLAFPPRSC